MCIVNLCWEPANLNCVGTLSGVLKQPVIRVEQLSRELEEKLSLRAAVVQPLLPVPADVQAAIAQSLCWGSHDPTIGIRQ